MTRLTGSSSTGADRTTPHRSTGDGMTDDGMTGSGPQRHGAGSTEVRRVPRPTARGLLAVFGVLALVVPVACSNDSETGVQQPSAEAGFVSGDGAITTVPKDERKPAPQLSGKTLDGDQVSLQDYRGSVVVLNIWGSWCPPCRKEAPELVAASAALSDENVQFLGIDTRDNDPAPARSFVAKAGIEYPNIYDPDGRLLLGFSGTVPPSSIPSTLVIDTEGRVAARILGDSTRTTFEDVVREVTDGSGGNQ